MKALFHKTAAKVPVARLWVNPDCGLKTTKELREELKVRATP
nr:hypothetical protein [Pseudoalteromonas translucida]